MTDKETARAKIAQLVERFQAIPRKERDDFTEQQTRVSFILPLFEALGWETSNPAEMSAEEQISRGFVDFGFYLNGVPVFYLETKRVREDISKPEYMKQAINYAYLKGVTWAVLTDFEDLLVFNADWEDPNPEKTRLFELSHTDYANGRFDDLWLLSKPSLAAREIDRVAEKYGKKAKREPVTSILFKQLTDWRYRLFQNIVGMKTTLWATDPHEVDNAVQKLIDRLIFIRSMEDRGVEEPRLQPLVRQFNRGVQFPELLKLFRELDGIYNSNLFAQGNLDFMELHDPDLLKEIINGLYSVPGSTLARYNFNAIDADVLGAVYEQYLGFKAQDPAGKQKLDPRKREKRKSQGIYYTPKFVVRYIVQQTVGRKLAEGVDAHSLRILDPACGSGSFLIEAFDVLDRHIAQKEPDLPAHERRQRILRENLYGVDLDDQAVEVTRLNLALRAAYTRERLPYLTNIKHGNSLIDDRAVAGETAFDWLDRFPEVMSAGGFDVVIGNPPYIRIQGLPSDQVAWMNERYESATANYDIYIPFVERGLSLLNSSGLLSYILPHKFFNAQYGKNLRGLITRGRHLSEVVHFGDQQVFEGATTYTAIIALSKEPISVTRVSIVNDLQAWLSGTSIETVTKDPMGLSETEWNFSSRQTGELLEKLQAFPTKLEDVTTRIFQGIKTSADKIYIVKRISGDTDKVQVFSDATGREHWVEQELFHPLIKGGDSEAYLLRETNRLILFPYEEHDGKMRLIPASNFAERFPLTWDYLVENREYLQNREAGKMIGEKWYGYVYPKSLDVIGRPKIFTPDIAPVSSFSLDDSGSAYFTGGTSGGYGILTSSPHSEIFLLGVLNSNLIEWYVHQTATSMRGGWFSYEARFIRQLPIRTINFDDPIDRARHDRMVTLVETMLRLKREHAAEAQVFSDKRHELAEQIERTDREIDALVYELYGLTDDEIALVEGRSGG